VRESKSKRGGEREGRVEWRRDSKTQRERQRVIERGREQEGDRNE
jgi:hypothetical protein